MHGLENMVKDRLELIEHLREVENAILTHLVENKRFEFFSINWNKLKMLSNRQEIPTLSTLDLI